MYFVHVQNIQLVYSYFAKIFLLICYLLVLLQYLIGKFYYIIIKYILILGHRQ